MMLVINGSVVDVSIISSSFRKNSSKDCGNSWKVMVFFIQLEDYYMIENLRICRVVKIPDSELLLFSYYYEADKKNRLTQSLSPRGDENALIHF